jgi:hypothetical protein
MLSLRDDYTLDIRAAANEVVAGLARLGIGEPTARVGLPHGLVHMSWRDPLGLLCASADARRGQAGGF